MAEHGIIPDRKPSRRGAVHLSEIVGKTIAPLTARRGFATADLIRAWGDIVGTQFAGCTRPDRIAWPKGTANEGRPGILVVRVEGPRAVLFQHEAGQVVERVNAFLGYAAIGQVRIMQGPVAGDAAPISTAPPPALPAEAEARLGQTLSAVDDEPLRSALARLGRGVLGKRAVTAE